MTFFEFMLSFPAWDLFMLAAFYIVICCVPYRIADRNGAPRPGGVLLFTFLLGWTGIGYVIACAYALLAGFFVKRPTTR